MKTSLRLLLLCAFVCLVSSAASAQQKTRQKPSTARAICKVQAVPRGMVVVAHKTNAACGEGFEFIVKKPAAAERVCANSPIPEGYRVDETAGSTACTGDNPLTNAYLISSGDGFYGIRVGMTSSEVWDKWGRPVETLRGTPGKSRQGITYRYRGSFGSTIYVYVEWTDNEYRVIGFEEHQARN